MRFYNDLSEESQIGFIFMCKVVNEQRQINLLCGSL